MTSTFSHLAALQPVRVLSKVKYRELYVTHFEFEVCELSDANLWPLLLEMDLMLRLSWGNSILKLLFLRPFLFSAVRFDDIELVTLTSDRWPFDRTWLRTDSSNCQWKPVCTPCHLTLYFNVNVTSLQDMAVFCEKSCLKFWATKECRYISGILWQLL